MNDNPIQLIHSYLNEIELLRDKALAKRKQLVELYDYDIIHDYRVTIYEQIDRLLIYHDTNIVLFLRYLINPQYISDLFHSSEEDSKRIQIDYLSRTRHSLIIFIQSVIESYYRALSNSLGLKPTLPFSKLCEKLFEKFAIDLDSDWYKANDILAKIRNTIHNNGIHTHPDNAIEYHNKKCVFIQNTFHNAGGYETIILIISDIIDFLYYTGEKTSHIELVDNAGCVDFLLFK